MIRDFTLILQQLALYFISHVAKLDNIMHLGLIVFFMGVAPVYLNTEDQDPNKDNKLPNNRLCPNNEVLLETLRRLKENLIDDVNSNLNPEKFKQILDSTMLYLNSELGSGNTTDKRHTSHFTTIGGNLNHREKKEAVRSNPAFGVRPEILQGSIGLQYQLPKINHPDCATLFKAIVNAINVAYVQLSTFCLESGKCYLQSGNILHPNNIPRPLPLIFPQFKQLPTANRSTMFNESNIIDFRGSYQNDNVMHLLQKYRSNMANGNSLPVPTSNVPNIKSSVQGNLFNHLQKGNENPDPLAILQSFRPKYINSIENYELPVPHEHLQMNTVSGLQENGNTWNYYDNFKPNASVAEKENLSNSGQHISTIPSLESNGDWNDLTREQDLVEFQTILNQPTGYMSVPGSEDVPLPNGKFPFHTFLEHNYTAPNTYFTQQFNTEPIYNNRNKIEVNKNISEMTDFKPWNNNLRLNSNVQNFPDNDIYRNLPTSQSGINIPYIGKNMGGVPIYEGNNGFNIKPPMNIQTGMYYSNAREPPFSQNVKNYLNQNYFSQMKPKVNDPKVKLPTSNIVKDQQAYNPQFLNWYQNQNALQNPYQNRGMTNVPNNMWGVNQMPHYSQIGTPISDSTFANQNHRNIPKELNDLYRLTMTNRAKLNITPNKNGIVELTFTLQRPQSYVYNPLYYVKYRLPYQTYMYNVKNILQKRPLLRNDPAKLYEELLDVANMSESSQDLKHLAKEEISKLIVNNGTLVKATVVDGSEDQKITIEDEIKGALHMASNLNPETMLNASEMALNRVEEAINTTVPKATKPNEGDELLPVKVLKTRSIRYPSFPQLTNFPPMNINGAYNIGAWPYVTKNRVVMATNPLGMVY